MEDDDLDYQIGYGHPPRRSQFQKGQSGNPSGRPYREGNLAMLTARELDARVEVGEEGHRETLSRRQAIARRLVELAAKGDLRAIKQLIDLLGSEKELLLMPPAPAPRPRIAEYFAQQRQQRGEEESPE